MAKSQLFKVSPPSDEDKEVLIEFATILQRNFEDIFDDAHSHDVMTETPQANEGTLQDIKLVDDGTDKYLAVRYNDGWYKTDLTAV